MTSTVERFQPQHLGNGRPTPLSQATAIEQSRAIAEVQAAVVVAQQVPRDMQRAAGEMRDTCGRLAMANHAFYQVDNRGTGPSVHLMRELARIWGNVQYGVNELTRNDVKGESEVQAWAWDVQTNTRSTRTFIVPHARMKRGSRVELTDLQDVYLNNQNIGARAVRECISTILPRWYTEEAQDRCRATLEHGEGKPLPQRIEEMINGFKGIGVSEKQIEVRLGKSRGQFEAGDVAQMAIVYTSITRDGFSRDEAFPPIEQTAAEILGDTGEETKPPRGRSKLDAKVKSAHGDTVSQPRQDLSESGPKPDNPQAEAPSDVTSPGAPTESTPGQTERVATAIANARKTSKARDALLDLITALFHQAGYDSLDELPTIASNILKLRINNTDNLTDSQLKTVHNSLNAWQQVGTLPTMIARILEAADMQAEQTQQDAQQPTLDSTN